MAPKVEEAGVVTRADVTELDVLIVGSGFSGLAMAHALKSRGIDRFVLLEKASDVGGTWRENTYPGAACDVPSHLYSFSFDPDPGWTRTYSPQPEIQAYLRRTAEKHGLLAHLRFGAEVEDATYDAEAGRWRVHTKDGVTRTARALVLGNGALHIPSVPHFEGSERFLGPQFHSAKWRHDVDLTGKRVAVIGTGASAIQFVPEIQKKVAKLTVFQRTAPWVVPKRDWAIPERLRALMLRRPLVQRAYRSWIYTTNELQAYGFVYEPRLLKLVSKLAIKHLEREVRDEALREKLTPRFTMGCKRVLLSNDWYASLTQPNVEVATERIQCIEEKGVRTEDGVLHEVDAILYGTGFAVADYLSSMRIHGRDGEELNASWRRTPQTYWGIMKRGFPNLFMLMGPNTGLGHNSMIFMIEAQARFAALCIERLVKEGNQALEVRERAQHAFAREVERRMPRTVWASGCQSWYQTGEGAQVTSLWPGFTAEYWLKTRNPRWEELELTARR